VQSFRTRQQAEACRRELETKARQEVSPFRFAHELELVSSIGEMQFLARLEQLRISPPARQTTPYGDYYQWSQWWEGTVDDLTDEQTAAVWALLDRLKFYRVSAVELEE
jgi:hypothetical protein